MVNLVNQEVLKILMPTEANSTTLRELLCEGIHRLTTASEDKEIVKVCMRMK